MSKKKIIKKDLYCPFCKNYPDVIIERYRDPIEETRRWDGEFFELEESNIGDVEYEQLCGKCRTHLVEKQQ